MTAPAEPRDAPRPRGPLEGLLVVDLTRVLAGPFATMMLADLGARVVKVERPGTGDDSRAYGPFAHGESVYFARVNRGKESVALDLKDPEDREVLLRLVDRADALVENYRPGVMDRLGLGYAALAQRSPRLVYASVSGFGQTGPWRERPAYDAVVQAMSGVMAITGAPDGPPVKPGLPVSDLAAGLYAYGAITTALLGAARTGRGTHVDVALFDATLSLLEGPALAHLATGEEPGRTGNAHFSIAPFDTFACADREVMVCAANDGHFARLAALVGHAEWVTDPRYATNRDRSAHRDALKGDLEAALAGDTAARWLERLEAAGVPCGPVLAVSEAVGSAQAAARRMVVTAGAQRLPGNPVKLSAYDDPLERPAAPGLDEHGDAVRAEVGLPRR